MGGVSTYEGCIRRQRCDLSGHLSISIVREFEDWLTRPRGAIVSSFPVRNWLDSGSEIRLDIGVSLVRFKAPHSV